MENNINQRERLVSTGTRALAVIGFIAIAAVGAFGMVQIAKGVPSAFSAVAAAIVSLTQVFVAADESITLSAPSLTVKSGETFALSWEHANRSDNGSYTFRYSCADGVTFNSPASSGSSVTVFCNTPFNFVNANDSILLTPISTNNRFVDVEVTIDFTPNGASASTVSGSAIVTVINEEVTTSPTVTNPTPTQPTPTTPRPATPSRGPETTSLSPIGGVAAPSNPNGAIDLTARVIEVGVVDKVTGAFTANPNPPRNPVNGRIAVRFAIENIGTKRSTEFTFNAILPTYPSHIYSSPVQQALNPGDRIEYTLGFDSPVDAATGEVTLNVDPTSSVMEPNKSNNIIKYTITFTR